MRTEIKHDGIITRVKIKKEMIKTINYQSKDLIRERYKDEHSLITEVLKELPILRPAINNMRTWGDVKKVLRAFGRTRENTAHRIIVFVDNFPSVDESFSWDLLKELLLKYQEDIRKKI